MRLGDLKLTLVDDGGFRLDGGAMFGVVPRPLWERTKPADERNRIQMTTNCLLVERGDDLLLVDTGVGDKGDAKFNDIFAVGNAGPRLPQQIARAGYEVEDVTHVLITHLHFDHCGWNTQERNGRLVPTFPNARYWLERGEVEHARHPNLRDRASYDRRNFEPLYEAGVVEPFSEEAEPVAGVRAVKVPGHNADMCIVLLEGGGETAVFWADLVPTASHVPYPWIMSYDLYPVQTLANKQRWLPRAMEGGWLSIFEHDPETPLARLAPDDKGRPRVEAVDPSTILPRRGG
jgi:glyoxylase-like metal-dependent hydrolase (beta-lactamase superfamily II)